MRLVTLISTPAADRPDTRPFAMDVVVGGTEDAGMASM